MIDLTKLESLIDQLAQQAAAIDRQRGESVRPLFDEQLFACRSKLLVPCVNETKGMLTSMRQEMQAGMIQTSRVAHICDKIVAQIQAIQREFATQNIRRKEPKRSTGWQRPISELYQDLARHQDWERRLAAMLRDKELMLGRCTTFAEQQQVQKEVLALEGRLARCRDALVKLEKRIQNQERKG